MARILRRGGAILGLAAFGLLSACGGPIDPNRPPKYDYEFEPVDQEGGFKTPSRV
ncbi:MAG: hypothetical protein MRY74_02075 [Neomegalonema sp.]|nr:hypothetical protein [Neomegalonema sp.]